LTLNARKKSSSLFCAVLCAFATPSWGQTFPERPLRIKFDPLCYADGSVGIVRLIALLVVDYFTTPSALRNSSWMTRCSARYFANAALSK
jgi:hypothetical protein